MAAITKIAFADNHAIAEDIEGNIHEVEGYTYQEVIALFYKMEGLTTPVEIALVSKEQIKLLSDALRFYEAFDFDNSFEA